jgi:hypothetical protein
MNKVSVREMTDGWMEGSRGGVDGWRDAAGNVVATVFVSPGKK